MQETEGVQCDFCPVHSERTRWHFCEGEWQKLNSSFARCRFGLASKLCFDQTDAKTQTGLHTPLHGSVTPNKWIYRKGQPATEVFHKAVGSCGDMEHNHFDVNWCQLENITPIWKIKENTWKVIFKLRPHGSFKWGRNRWHWLQYLLTITLSSYCRGPLVTEVVCTLDTLSAGLRGSNVLSRAHRTPASQACHRKSGNQRRLVLKSTQNPSCLPVSDK